VIFVQHPESSFDLIVIGAGQAGPTLAARMVHAGCRVALVESRELGGTCANWGCTPTKTLRKSARVAHLARHAAEFGVQVGEVHVDFRTAMERMQARVDAARSGLDTWLSGLAGLTIFKAHGRLAGRDGRDFVVFAGTSRLTAPRIILNTGTRPFIPAIPGLGALPFLDNESLLKLREMPEHLLIVGGSYIGLEMAQIFRRLGSRVSIVEGGPRLAGREDADVSTALLELLESEGIHVYTGNGVQAAAPIAGGVELRLADGVALTGSHVLVAAGRSPNTETLGLDTLGGGIKIDHRGFIATDGGLETGVPGIWALGDINGRGAFTHTSYQDHDIVAENLLTKSPAGRRSADKRFPIYAMFTDPPLGHVGLYEAEARNLVSRGWKISQAVISMGKVSRALQEGETTGVIKVLIDEQSRQIVGATMLGIGADEVIQIFGHAISAGTDWKTVRNTLPVHPTVTEFIPTLIDRRKPLSADVPGAAMQPELRSRESALGSDTR
jgi:pyruvate/2-oxoglutarate dehydrogenase complex dihydrolipoamide dehydrogenase (E3) component